MQITTPSGYVVTLKDKLSFGETRALQKFLIGDEKVELVNGVPQQPKIAVVKAMEYTERAMGFLVTEIKKGEVVITTDIDKEIFKWDEADGNAVMAEVDKIVTPNKTAQAVTEEKKTL